MNTFVSNLSRCSLTLSEAINNTKKTKQGIIYIHTCIIYIYLCSFLLCISLEIHPYMCLPIKTWLILFCFVLTIYIKLKNAICMFDAIASIDSKTSNVQNTRWFQLNQIKILITINQEKIDINLHIAILFTSIYSHMHTIFNYRKFCNRINASNSI